MKRLIVLVEDNVYSVLITGVPIFILSQICNDYHQLGVTIRKQR